MQVRAFQQLQSNERNLQLICFPYLGGSAHAFFDFAQKFSEKVEVWSANLPGHGTFRGNLLEDIDAVVDLYQHELQHIVKPNYLFFGHSMGGVIAYFLTQRILISGNYESKPRALILSASAPPSSFYAKNYSSWSDKDLLQYVASYGDIADEITKEKSLLEYLIPIFRADFAVLESASTCTFKPLDIPVYFLWGERDKVVSIDAVLQWSKYFSSEIHLISIQEGSHLFIQDQLNRVVEKIDFIIDHLKVQRVENNMKAHT